MDEKEFKNFKENCPFVQGLNDRSIEIEYYRYKISSLKTKLANSDFKALKFIEGYYTDQEYEPIKIERQGIRDQINKYQDLIDKLDS